MKLKRLFQRRKFWRIALYKLANEAQIFDQWLHLVARLAGTRLVMRDVLQLIRRHDSNTSGWIASSPVRISHWDVFKRQMNTPVVSDYSDRMLINKSARQVLERISVEAIEGFEPSRIVAGLEFLNEEQRALNARESLAARGWIGRKLHAARLLRSGCYRHFNGYKSFLRDIAR